MEWWQWLYRQRLGAGSIEYPLGQLLSPDARPQCPFFVAIFSALAVAPCFDICLHAHHFSFALISCFSTLIQSFQGLVKKSQACMESVYGAGMFLLRIVPA